MRVAFLYRFFYHPDGQHIHIGGVETYIRHLIALTAGMGFQPLVFQPARVAFERQADVAPVFGVPVDRQSPEEQKRSVYESAVRHLDDDDLVVFGADHYSVRTERTRAISIQHGIDWDVPTVGVKRLTWLLPNARARREQRRHIERALRYFDNCPNHVCVDYNFPNWYRATRGRDIGGKVWVIPNCCRTARPEQVTRPERQELRVLFARRFEFYRGTRVMADAVERVLQKRADIVFTFAGEGPDTECLKERLANRPQVRFIRYLPDESLAIHLEHDIAVIPSLGSEGTSLSAAEAMGAGCAVIASPIGGITNMILHNYNGVLTRPVPEDLSGAIMRLADDVVFRRQVAANAYRTAVTCFDMRVWQDRWREVFDCMASMSR